MNKSASVICLAFLEKMPQQRRHAILGLLSREESLAFQQQQSPQGDPTTGTTPFEEELPRMHYSWFASFLRSLPEGDIKIFLGGLTPPQQKGLKHSLLYSNHIPPLSHLGERFIRQKLFHSLLDETDLLPIICLPSTPLNALLDMSYEELIFLIDLLSMHDLSVEMRQIIDTKKLKTIHSMLSTAQSNFLKTLIHRKESVVFKKMELTKWDGHAKTLTATLEQRGINRLAKALYIADPSLTWYVAHHLDTERGELLRKLCTPLDHPRAALLLSEQVVALIDTLKNQDEL